MSCEYEFFNNEPPNSLASIAENYCSGQLDEGDIITDAIIIGYATNPNHPDEHAIVVNSGECKDRGCMVYMLEDAQHSILNTR
ncbi:hypothetical protein HW450_06670 [Corynebacterium hindlerae]|uniref:Uncharacterized protein n=1 Tax=Corynebacterium hindlerae TaxID=699041 RepID=A0A7G5FBT4_9CORY|nr:hypothetical protein [Corynebacterium hindlerae]QMV84075.1 hypothetical protein HW450_06670 [Corynebacterium hindlerae]